MVGCVGIQLFVLQTAVISYPQGHVLKEKEQIIIRLQNQIRDLQAQLAGGAGLMREKEALVMRIKELEGLLAQRDAEIARLNAIIVELRARVTELEDLLIRARSEVREIHVAPAPPKEEMRWYYAVQDPQHAHLFQTVCYSHPWLFPPGSDHFPHPWLFPPGSDQPWLFPPVA